MFPLASPEVPPLTSLSLIRTRLYCILDFIKLKQYAHSNSNSSHFNNTIICCKCKSLHQIPSKTCTKVEIGIHVLKVTTSVRWLSTINASSTARFTSCGTYRTSSRRRRRRRVGRWRRGSRCWRISSST